MKTVTNISIISAGYGHNTIILSFSDGTVLKATTNNTRLTDRIKGTAPGEDQDADEARVEAIQLVFNANFVDYEKVTPVQSRNGIQWDVE